VNGQGGREGKGRDGKGREGKGREQMGNRGYGMRRDGSTWIFVQKPRVPSYATVTIYLNSVANGAKYHEIPFWLTLMALFYNRNIRKMAKTLKRKNFFTSS